MKIKLSSLGWAATGRLNEGNAQVVTKSRYHKQDGDLY
jgi:hypothetical protein